MGKGKRYIHRWQTILEDSYRSKQAKIQSFRSKFEQCSGVCAV